MVPPVFFLCRNFLGISFLVLGRHPDNLMTSRMTFCSKNIETVPLFYCNFDSISFCVLTTSVLIRDCNFKTTSTFLSVVSFKVYSTKISSSQEYDDKYVWDCDQSSWIKFSEIFWMKFLKNVENFIFNRYYRAVPFLSLFDCRGGMIQQWLNTIKMWMAQ